MDHDRIPLELTISMVLAAVAVLLALLLPSLQMRPPLAFVAFLVPQAMLIASIAFGWPAWRRWKASLVWLVPCTLWIALMVLSIFGFLFR